MSSSSENMILSAICTRTILNLFCKILFRFLHFFLNGLILRQIDVNIIGIANVRLQLLYTTILFLSREAFRRTVPKLNDRSSIHHYINLVWLILPVGLFIISLTLPFTLFIQTDGAEKYPFYYYACSFYALAAFIELLSEPFYLLATVTLNYHINIYVEMFASTVGFTIQAILIYMNRQSALYFYGFGYIIYSLLITSSYYLYFLTRTKEERRRLFKIASLKDLIIKPTHPYFDYKLFNETKTFFKQGIWMKLLTEGERYIMSIFNLISYKDQAIFDTINNLGSLLPRLIFSTLEESAYTYFQQTLSRTKTIQDQHIQGDEMLSASKQHEVIKKNVSPSLSAEQQTIKLNALTFYNYLLRFVIIISLLVITFGIPYSRIILNFYGGSNLIEGSGPTLLRLYCIYILFLAINGITEAFSQATMPIEQLEKYKNLISIFALFYLGIFYILINIIGIYGIIIANCLNMLLRIITNLYYIHQYFDSMQRSNPFQFSFYYLFTLFVSSCICYYSETWFAYTLIHFIFGVFLGSGMLLMLYKTNEEKATEYNSTIDQENENQGEIIISRSSSQSIQHPLPDKREALRLNNLPPTTLCAYVNHKVTLCKPITRSKAISCAPITFNRATQTLLDEETPPISLLPIPVGLVTPLPLALGTTDCPVPVPVPIPVPFPLFFVINDQKFQDYESYLQKLKEVLPINDEDTQLLVYAQTLFPNDDLLGLGKFNPKSSPLDEVENDEVHIVGRASDGNNQIEQELTAGDNVLNKLVFDFEDFDLSTMALTGGEQHLNTTNGNSSEKIEYLMRQEDAKYILKWHFGVKLFRAWIESKNKPIRQRLFQQNTRARNLSSNDADNSLLKRLYRSDPLLYRADELNTALCLFLKEIRDLYDGDSIYYLCLGIQHYLRENHPLSSSTTTTRRFNEGHFYRTESIFFDSTFFQFQSKLHSILVRFCHHRDPSRPLSMRGPTSSNIDDRPSRIEEELLWEAKQLGAHTPWVLLNTILYFNTKYFFLKTVNEHQVLSFSNVRRHYKRNVGPHGEEYGKSVYL
ncbi:unnamed protein product, partial [Rotaria magnacalcarata]